MEMIEKLCCPICEKNDSVFYREVYDDRYAYPGKFDLYKCKHCSHIHLNVNFEAEVIEDLYTNYYPRNEYDINLFKPSKEVKGISAWLRGSHFASYTRVPTKVKILDIGCAFGETLAYYQNRGCEAHGSEVDKNAIKSVEKLGLNIKIGVYNSSNYPKSYFDYVVMDQLIEHISDPVSFLKGVSENLKTGGLAIISTPNAHGWGVQWYKEKWLHWHAPYHLHFFSKKSFEIVAKKANLEIVNVKSVTLSDWLFWQRIHLHFRPKENEPNLFWKFMNPDKYNLIQKQKIKEIRKIRGFRLYDLITRFFDFLQIGDNVMYELRKPK